MLQTFFSVKRNLCPDVGGNGANKVSKGLGTISDERIMGCFYGSS